MLQTLLLIALIIILVLLALVSLFLYSVNKLFQTGGKDYDERTLGDE